MATCASSCLFIEVETAPNTASIEPPPGSGDTLREVVREAPGFSGILPIADMDIDAQGWAWLGWYSATDESPKGLAGFHLQDETWFSRAFPAPYENSPAAEVEVAGDGRIFCRPDISADQLFAFTPAGWETYAFSGLIAFDAHRSSEELWALDADGLHLVKDGATTLFNWENLPSDTSILTLSAIPGGGVWALTADNALIRYDGAGWESFKLPMASNDFEEPDIAAAPDGSVYLYDVPAFARFGADGALLNDFSGDMLEEGWLFNNIHALPQTSNLVLGGDRFFVHYDQQSGAYTYFDLERGALIMLGDRFYVDADEAGTIYIAAGGVIAALPEYLR